jgi:hypothetical protein
MVSVPLLLNCVRECRVGVKVVVTDLDLQIGRQIDADENDSGAGPNEGSMQLNLALTENATFQG